MALAGEIFSAQTSATQRGFTVNIMATSHLFFGSYIYGPF